MESDPRRTLITREFQRAWKARQGGREGLARVCARRAAGWALPPPMATSGSGSSPPNALRKLAALASDPQAPPQLRQAAARLTVHVTPNHELPHPQDPLEDARLIIEACVPGALPSFKA